MADPIRVSRQGLTCCPSCYSHIKIADEVAQTSCPFCHASLAEGGAPRRSGVPRFGAKGRTLLAASLLGAAVTFTACPGAPQPSEKTVADGGLPAPAYGIPAQDSGQPETAPAPDAVDGPLYGNVPSDK